MTASGDCRGEARQVAGGFHRRTGLARNTSLMAAQPAPHRSAGQPDSIDIMRALPFSSFMESFLISTGVVALGEMGDKTQLLAILLAARFRRPWPIIVGILAATLANHALAAAVGGWVAHQLGPT